MSIINDVLREIEAKKKAERDAISFQRWCESQERQKEWQRQQDEYWKQRQIEREREKQEKEFERLHPHHKPGYELEKAFNDQLEILSMNDKIDSFKWISTEEKKVPYDFIVYTNDNEVYYFDTVGFTMTEYGRMRLHTSHKHLDDTLDELRKQNRASRFYLVFDIGEEFMVLRVKHGLPTANINLSKQRYKSCRRFSRMF